MILQNAYATATLQTQQTRLAYFAFAIRVSNGL